jgi:SPP1 gp7 family putative phage head morphogenesis protein
MSPESNREALKSLLFSQRKKLGRASRVKHKKPASWLYPWATERHYRAVIQAWMRPAKQYVADYLKQHQEDILHGDSATIIRNDATTGRAFNVMVNSLYGWAAKNVPPLESNRPPQIYLGLGKIADSAFDFNGKQYDKAFKTELGVEFPVYEDWWPDARKNWTDYNYRHISNNINGFIGKVNTATEKAVTSGWSVGQLTEEISKLNRELTSSQAAFLARDQIGKLNGEVTHRRMESAGISCYIWSTSGDDRVRESHAELDGKLCRWDNADVYSEDGGKTWIQRPANWIHLHPGEDYQCRCTAVAYFDDIVAEVDKKIDIAEGETKALSNGQLFKDPGEAEPATFPQDPNFSKMSKEFLERDGQQVESITAETDYVRRMGEAAGNVREYATIVQGDGTIMKSLRGKARYVPIPDDIDYKIRHSPDDSVTLIHYHTSGCSLSPDDLGSFSEVRAFHEIRVATPRGSTFVMSIKEGSEHPTAERIKADAVDYKPGIDDILMPQYRRERWTMAEKERQESRALCQILAKKYNWDYREIKPNGKK